ncbi:restriction endonuclease subunit S [Halarcobacter anaerophilus]|uniref:restriction endonuclease subunit S n=1 Tax=Halarcobacter anaerophilus TaxID=877500 RepID=UPI0005CA88DA|nr:restriction endonuclease subunit S [Halarcobacter anaerophilus]
MNNEKLRVPKLRFKEFSGEWEEKCFGDIYNFLQTNSFSRALLNYENGDVKNVHYGDIHTKFKSNFYIQDETVPYINQYIDLSKIKEENYCKEKDLVIADASEDYKDIGKAIELIDLNNEKLLAGLHTYIARDDKDKMALGFSGYFMQTHSVRVQMMKMATGISVLGISKGNLNKLELIIPQKQEQEKIASFLSSIDKKINQLSKKDKLLQNYKKAMMQKIFSQKLRFKKEDGSDYPKWEEKKLEKFLILTLREVSKPKNNYLAIGVRSHCKGTFQKPNSEPEKIALDRLYQVKENDLIVSITFAWESAIAIVKKEDENGLVSHRFPTYTFDETIMNVNFFRYVIVQKEFRFMLELISPGGAGRNRVMSKKDFLKLNINLPSLEEQTKIANFLSSLDTKISQNRKALEETQKFKKALLQKMFV